MKDLLGNELTVGDIVHIKIENIWVYATIAKLQDGGLSLGIAAQPGQPPPQTPDTVVVQIGASFPQTPGTHQQNIVRLDRPQPEGMIQ